MVMVDDAKLRHARLTLLHDLREAMNRVADISKLAQ
jgi:glycyl-tRNA synthetase beta subunit